LGLVMLVGMVASARPRTTGAEAAAKEDDIRKLEQQWLDAAAVPDLPALRKLIAEDFMGTSFGGKKVLTKVDVVPEDDFDTSHMPKCTLKDSTVKIFGDTAVLMGQVEMEIPQNPEMIRMTTVFQKHGENWQVIAVHMSKAPAA
jgi:ketosteroid isomerase-like protein